jgi:hypothetical protein
MKNITKKRKGRRNRKTFLLMPNKVKNAFVG